MNSKFIFAVTYRDKLVLPNNRLQDCYRTLLSKNSAVCQAVLDNAAAETVEGKGADKDVAKSE